MVHSIMYRYRWIIYTVYRKYTIIVLQVGRVDECDITYHVKLVVTL
jgi:hypothetical protein